MAENTTPPVKDKNSKKPEIYITGKAPRYITPIQTAPKKAVS